MTASVRGTLTVDGQPVPDQPVLLLTDEPVSLLGSATTGSDGRFDLAVPADSSSALAVLARVSTPQVLAALVAEVGAGGGKLDLSVGTDDVIPVSWHLEVDGRWPPFVTLTAQPLELSGVPARFQAMFTRRSAQVVDAYFFSRNEESADLELRMQPGRYRLNASYVNRSRPNLVNPDFDNVVTAEVEVSGAADVTGSDPSAGVEVDLLAPARVTFRLRVLPDRELLGG